MSDRLSAAAIATEALEFGWRRFFTTVRYGWLTFLLCGLGLGGSIFLLLGGFSIGDGAEREPMWLALPVVLVASILSGILISGFYASLYRLVALGEDRQGIFQIRFDGAARRTFFAILIMSLISILIWFFAALIAKVLTGTSFQELVSGFESLMDNPENYAGAAGIFKFALLTLAIGTLPGIYVGVKLAAFPAACAVENRLVLLKSYAMTKGHAWSIFGAVILYSLAFFALSIVLELSTSIIGLIADYFVSQSGDGINLASVLLLIAPAIQVCFQIFTVGVQVAFGGSIYRRLAAD